MGTYGCYTGKMNIPDEKKDEFARQAAKLLNFGGMMQFERISMYGHDMGLLKPVELYPGGKVHFHFNYFEDDSWETAMFDANDGYFRSEKIGGQEFCDVVTAIHFLYEVYDDDWGFAEINGDIINNSGFVGWINHLLGTDFSMKKRFRIWENMEALRQDGYFTFFDTPKELRGKPNYYLSDDDRLYWWDGTDEVILSDEMDGWLRELAIRHKEIMAGLNGDAKAPDEFFRKFLLLLVEIDQYYKRIFPFQSMFYEFLQNGGKTEYRAAIELLKRISDENREDGKIIEKAKSGWDITSRNVTHNIGRLKLKRYLSVMANLALRRNYFGF